MHCESPYLRLDTGRVLVGGYHFLVPSSISQMANAGVLLLFALMIAALVAAVSLFTRPITSVRAGRQHQAPRAP
jgi:hypothetical protein